MATRKRKRPAPKRKAATKARSKTPAKRKPAKKKVRATRRTRASASIAGTFEMLLAPHARTVRDLATRLRALIRDSLPDAEEHVRGSARVGMAFYSIGASNQVVCGIQPSAGGCLLSVHYVDADDSSGLRLEDEGAHVVHIKFRSINRDEEAALSALVRLARERMLG
jgi:hypothetical protein